MNVSRIKCCFRFYWLSLYGQNKTEQIFFRIFHFMFHRRKKVIQVWNNMKVSKLHNFHFRTNYFIALLVRSNKCEVSKWADAFYLRAFILIISLALVAINKCFLCALCFLNHEKPAVACRFKPSIFWRKKVNETNAYSKCFKLKYSFFYI